METKKLIEIAKTCGVGDCHPACPYKEDEWDLESVMYCMEDLISALADKLEMAIADIGKNCSTCTHSKKSWNDPPCSLCKPLEFSRWEWRGDADGK